MTLRLVCVVRIFFIPTVENAKAGYIAGSVAGVNIMYERGGFMWEICANDYVASDSVVRGSNLTSTVGVFFKLV